MRVKVPSALPQWLPLRAGVEAGQRCFISLQELLRENAASLFPGVEILETTLFRVSRNADIAIEEDSDNSIRELVEEQVRQRRFQPVVRLEFAANPSSEIRDSLVGRFELRDGDVYELTDMLDYSGLFELASLPIRSCATRRGRRCHRSALRRTPTSSRRSAPATCWCTIRMKASTPRSSASSATRPTTPRRRRSR